MSGRTINKRLMRGRQRTFWGRRAFVRIRFPLSVCPEPYPPVEPPEGFVPDDLGDYEKKGPPYQRLFVTWLYGSDPPEDTLFVKRFADGSGAKWVDSEIVTYKGLDLYSEILSREDFRDEGFISQCLARENWENRWIHGMHTTEDGDYEYPGPFWDALFSAFYHAKTVYYWVDGDDLVLVPSVKWFYPDRRRAFCRELSKALRISRREGFRMTIRS